MEISTARLMLEPTWKRFNMVRIGTYESRNAIILENEEVKFVICHMPSEGVTPATVIGVVGDLNNIEDHVITQVECDVTDFGLTSMRISLYTHFHKVDVLFSSSHDIDVNDMQVIRFPGSVKHFSHERGML